MHTSRINEILKRCCSVSGPPEDVHRITDGFCRIKLSRSWHGHHLTGQNRRTFVLK